MTNTLSLDFKSSALLIALILVPIVVLVCAVAIALACSEYWSIHSIKQTCLSCCRLKKQRRRKQIRSDPEGCNIVPSTLATECSDIQIEIEVPVTNREHV
ncbi:hypothetical protein N7499_009571 [Penicillium canescens]|uniref:Uncharacterized protein n=1 Tax=Penicillium canescens TaxID=5083 RepID=A0AAD6NEH3_PENCN|nr:uncharacterized protein N7446_008403 [Penicillium canescens]KAJ6019265.1 hypothetical protein N7522_001332 [Penicillium canescens]KAJ6033307.1 hypothetical protein N7444_011078 [Penicillium canescens]KAJ6057504.1 hypothetical protein N7460_000778 [Penicillium canescens]KAJ6058820.1 hypothetical protein N7446_008403 [Penicillium canescens]KAJ6071557.1 hypothetical protein N7499_009571 [Penicillium canescens]